MTPLHHHRRLCLGHGPARRQARRSGCLTTFGLSSPAQPALPPGELRYKGRKGLAINCMRMGDGSRSGISDTSLPSDLWQKRKTGPTRKEAVCKDLVAKRGPQSHSHLHGFGAICHELSRCLTSCTEKQGALPQGCTPGVNGGSFLHPPW